MSNGERKKRRKGRKSGRKKAEEGNEERVDRIRGKKKVVMENKGTS